MSRCGAIRRSEAGFTLLELILAVLLLGVMTTVSILTFRAVTTGWRVSREYVDRLERTDYAIDQLVSALRCMYYPHAGEQSYDYGFMLTDRGDGESVNDSDVIEWSKRGAALIGAGSVGDTVHRVQVRVLEEGDSAWGEPIECTGLYARVKPHATVNAEDSKYDADEFGFSNDELYRPILIAKDVEGFDCRVQKTAPQPKSTLAPKEDADAWEEEFDSSNAVPYKIQLTLYVLKEDPQYASRKTRVPVLRSVTIPVHEQSLSGEALPDEAKKRGPRR